MALSASELILNADGSIYHLNLLPQDISDTIITVGDPERVAEVSEQFDRIRLKKGKREFVTHTGLKNGKEITVISTGIGTDNIDIVLNELDALANINLSKREQKKEFRPLDIIRIGTSGAIQAHIPVDSFLMTSTAIGMDALMRFYDGTSVRDSTFEKALERHLGQNHKNPVPYAVHCDGTLAKKFTDNRIRLGITITAPGFYGPQFRKLRAPIEKSNTILDLRNFSYKNEKITNIEMETAGIYALSRLLGHRAVSLNAILANRTTGEFSKKPKKTIEELIEFALERLTA